MKIQCVNSSCIGQFIFLFLDTQVSLAPTHVSPLVVPKVILLVRSLVPLLKFQRVYIDYYTIIHHPHLKICKNNDEDISGGGRCNERLVLALALLRQTDTGL